MFSKSYFILILIAVSLDTNYCVKIKQCCPNKGKVNSPCDGENSCTDYLCNDANGGPFGSSGVNPTEIKLNGCTLNNTNEEDSSVNFDFITQEDGTLELLEESNTIDHKIFCLEGDENGSTTEVDLDGIFKQAITICRYEYDAFENLRRIVYITLNSIAACFAFMTIMSFLVVYEKQNIHGWTQCTHVFSFFMLLISWLGSEFDMVDLKDTACKYLAIFNHFIYISTFSWLVVVNFDLMKAFWIPRHKDRIPKCLPIYLNYCMFGWGVPGLIVSISVGLDFFLGPDSTKVENMMLPNYGLWEEAPCSVDFIGWPYVLLPNGTLFILVILIILNTLRVVWMHPGWFQTQSKSHNEGKILIWKILLAMGSFWFLDVLSLFYITVYHELSWYLVAMDFFVLLQAIPIFLIYVCRPDSLNNLSDKFPKCRGCLEALGRAFCVDMRKHETAEEMKSGSGRLRAHRGSVVS